MFDAADALDAAALIDELAQDAEAWRVEVVESLDSSNAECLRRAESGEPAGLALFADYQEAGRGRRGKEWLSPPGQALLFSVLLRPEVPVSLWSRYALAFACAVCDAVEELSPLQAGIKWPNDIIVQGCKLAGILLESRPPCGEDSGVLVAGIGLNVHTTRFSEGLRLPATSLRLATGQAPSRVILAAALLKAISRRVEQVSDDWNGLCTDFSKWDLALGQRLRAQTPRGVMDGVGEGIDEDGEYQVRTRDGEIQRLCDAYHLEIEGESPGEA